MLRKFNVVLSILVLSSGVFGQTISGIVVDAGSKEAIPFANVWIRGTLQGTQSDSDGRFTLKTPKGDTLVISTVGYIQQEFIIDRNESKQLSVELEKEVKEIDEVTVKSDIPFARVVFNLIQKHKKENREKLEQVRDYKMIENTTVYIAVDTTSRISRFFDNMDEVTVELDGQTLRFSPIYLFEQGTEVHGDSVHVAYKKKDGIFPRINPAIESLLLKNVVVDIDFYKDQIHILDRGFISPISGSALLYYNIYFNDTIFEGDHKYFHMTYAPKNPLNPLFSGNFIVDSETFALKQVDAYISEKANLNFVNGFKGTVTYQALPGGGYFFDEQNVGINLAIRLNKDSTSNYSSKRVDNVASGNWVINKTTHYSNSARLDNIKPAEWKNQPEFELAHVDEGTYSSVKKLKEQKVVKGIDKIGGMALTSFFNVGKLDIGPVFDIYSTNRIEGTRFTVPLRTSEQVFQRFSVGGFLGYGTRNKEFKYGGNLKYQPGQSDKFLLSFRYYNDYNLVSQDKFLRFVKNNPNNKGNANFIAAFTTREKNPYLMEEQYVEFRFEYNSTRDWHWEVSPYVLSNRNTPFVHFVRNGVDYRKYRNYGVLFNLRYAFRQHYEKFFMDRVYFITPVPVINLSWDVGQVSLPGNSEDPGIYSQIHGSVQGRILLGQVFLNYMLNGGFLLGDAPFDLLDQPVGSMSLGYAKYRFNLLHHASFAHNVYTNLHAHLNGGGIVLNKIPFIRSFKLREIVSLKAHYGDLTKSYNQIFDLPQFYNNEQKKPYAEIGFGVTNIFKVLRVEYVRHLGRTYKNSDFTDEDGIFFRAEMSF